MQHLVQARRRYVQMVTGKKPRRRPMPKALPPKAIETAYTRILLDLVHAMRIAAHRDLIPKLHRYAEHARDVTGRTDAIDDDVGLVKASLTNGAFAKSNLGSLAKMIGRRTSDWQKAQLGRQLRAAVGVDVPIRDPRLAERIELCAHRKGPSRQAVRVPQRGKRQKDLGLTHFVWETSHDERVRPEHRGTRRQALRLGQATERGHSWVCRKLPMQRFARRGRTARLSLTHGRPQPQVGENSGCAGLSIQLPTGDCAGCLHETGAFRLWCNRLH
jgi:hypothetical protein